MRVYIKLHVQYNSISVHIKTMKWEDITRCCLWCWCIGTQDLDDTDTEEIYGGTEPIQETENTHGLIAPLNNSILDEACEELLLVLLDETEDSYNPSLVAPLNNSVLDEAWEKLRHVLLDEIEVSLNVSVLDDAWKELLQVLLDETEVSLNTSSLDDAWKELLQVLLDETKVSLNTSALDDAWKELLHVLLDETEDSYNPSLDASPCGRLCEGSSPRSLSRISHQTHITVEHFTFHSVLGQGSYGKVFLAELKGSKDLFAVKALRKDVMNNNVEFTMVEKRVLALAWDCPFLTHLYSTFQTEEHLFFVMEYLTGGDLMFHIRETGSFDLYTATFYAAEIVCGLQFLHGKGIIHRDLKLDNVMLDGEGHIKIADFGMCKENVFGDNLGKTFCGTPYYMAPEIILGERYSFSVDWWSFGVLLYGMLIGKPPFDGEEIDDIFDSIIMDIPDFPDWITLDTRDMLERLFEQDPSYRLGVVPNIRGHSFFEIVDWSALERREIQPPYVPVKSSNDGGNCEQELLNDRLSMCEKGLIGLTDQSAFAGFSFVNQHMEHLLQGCK
ncbi:protein kinase C delta type-like [Brachyhypopomus gauderio]|uniref:protein kinase C delta type-like n=2 Tax=Brachyhypopomus gauderio TaxID=698409 RepID=UPI00404285A5